MNLPYARHQVTEADIAAVVSVLRSDHLTQGPVVPKLEEALAEYVGAKYAVAVNSGTAALELAYAAVGGWWTVKHAVTSPLSFVATASAAIRAGHTVGFVDVDPQTGNVAHSTLDCDIFVPVHYAGRACPMPAHAPALPPLVIEDACQALGAWDFDGCSRVGSCAHSLATCFSFHASKPVAAGEGGAITTNDEGLAMELRSLRDHGREGGLCTKPSGNYRLSEMAAALALSQLGRVDETTRQRWGLAQHYSERRGEFGERVDFGLSPTPFTPWWRTGPRHAFHLYPVRIKNGRRDEVKAKLNAFGIQAQVHYRPIHEQPWCERQHFEPESFPEAHAWGAEELSLPLHAGMNESDVARVCDALREALA